MNLLEALGCLFSIYVADWFLYFLLSRIQLINSDRKLSQRIEKEERLEFMVDIGKNSLFVLSRYYKDEVTERERILMEIAQEDYEKLRMLEDGLDPHSY